MSTVNIAIKDLEIFYDELAESIDKAGPEKASLFLAKLALLLANEVADVTRLRQALQVSLQDL